MAFVSNTVQYKEEKMQLDNQIMKMFPEITPCDNFLDLLDETHYSQLFGGNSVYIWGTGETTKGLLKNIAYLRVSAFVDNFPKTEYIAYGNKDIPVIKPQEMDNNYYIIVSSIYYEDIKKQLLEMGKTEYLDFISVGYLYPKPSDLVKEIENAEFMTNWKCMHAWSTVNLESNGNFVCCSCSARLKYSFANVFIQKRADIQNSIPFRLFKYSIETGKYCFCNSERCSGLRKYGGGTVLDKSFLWEKLQEKNNQLIVTAKADFDKSCNLHCESCRNHVIYEENAAIKYLCEYFMENMFPKAEIINCAGMGEVFLSKYYKRILDCCDKKKKLLLFSNGNLATGEVMRQLAQKVGGNISVMVSIDAACESTYLKLRRGGNWNTLIRNLKHMGELVKSGKMKWLILAFVVSRNNYREMPAFVELGKSVGATAIHFSKLQNWGTYTPEEYNELSMFDSKNESITDEFSVILDEVRSEKNIKVYITEEYQERMDVYEALLIE